MQTFTVTLEDRAHALNDARDLQIEYRRRMAKLEQIGYNPPPNEQNHYGLLVHRLHMIDDAIHHTFSTIADQPGAA